MTQAADPTTTTRSNGDHEAKPAPATLTLGDLLAKRRDLIATVLPKHLSPERLIKLATVAVGRDPKLGRATALSIVNAVVKAAELGLDCSGTLGSAYLVAYNNSKKDANGNWYKQIEAQLIIGYRGLIDLARRSGEIASIEARVVWQNDEFDFEYGLEPRLKHKPALDKEPGELRLVYGIGKLKDGAIQIEVMTKAEIDRIKNRSQSGSESKSPWNTDYSEMARKTVVKRLCKYLPLSVEVQEAIVEDNAADPIDVGESTQLIEQQRGVKGLLDKMTKRPVSEGQTFVPEPEAVAEAAQEQPAPPDPAIIPDAAPSNVPPEREADAGAEVDAERKAIAMREALEDPDSAKRNLYEHAKRHGMTKGTYEPALFKWLMSRQVGDILKSTLDQRLELWNEIQAGTFPPK